MPAATLCVRIWELQFAEFQHSMLCLLQAELAAQLCLLTPAHNQGLIPYMSRMMHAVTKVSGNHMNSNCNSVLVQCCGA